MHVAAFGYVLLVSVVVASLKFCGFTAVFHALLVTLLADGPMSYCQTSGWMSHGLGWFDRMLYILVCYYVFVLGRRAGIVALGVGLLFQSTVTGSTVSNTLMVACGRQDSSASTTSEEDGEFYVVAKHSEVGMGYDDCNSRRHSDMLHYIQLAT
jgi:hypothetical protein